MGRPANQLAVTCDGVLRAFGGLDRFAVTWHRMIAEAQAARPGHQFVMSLFLSINKLLVSTSSAATRQLSEGERFEMTLAERSSLMTKNSTPRFST